jgi:hypothetical protein
VRCLIPFGTAWDLAAGAAMIVLVLASGYAVAGDAAISNATRAFRYGWDRGSQVTAIEDLARWSAFLPDKVIARQTSGKLGPGMFEPFADRYREVTGVDLVAVDPFGAGD